LSIQLFGSTDVTPKVFHVQSYLLHNALICRHDVSLHIGTPFRSLDWGNLVCVLSTRAYTLPIT
jgi:hypothetical protein